MNVLGFFVESSMVLICLHCCLNIMCFIMPAKCLMYCLFHELSHFLNTHLPTLFTYWVMIPCVSLVLLFIRCHINHMSHMFCTSYWHVSSCVLTSRQGHVANVAPYILIPSPYASWHRVKDVSNMLHLTSWCRVLMCLDVTSPYILLSHDHMSI